MPLIDVAGRKNSMRCSDQKYRFGLKQ